MSYKDKYEEKIGKLQENTLECAEQARQIYILLKDEKSDWKREILEDVINNLRRASQKIGWIDTRSFESECDTICTTCGNLKIECKCDK